MDSTNPTVANLSIFCLPQMFAKGEMPQLLQLDHRLLEVQLRFPQAIHPRGFGGILTPPRFSTPVPSKQGEDFSFQNSHLGKQPMVSKPAEEKCQCELTGSECPSTGQGHPDRKTSAPSPKIAEGWPRGRGGNRSICNQFLRTVSAPKSRCGCARKAANTFHVTR